MTSPSNESAGTSTSLYDQLGGEPAVKEAVSRFYRRVVADPQLADLFTDTDMGRLEAHQVAFFTQVMGGPEQYSGRAMNAAHRGLGISDAQFDLVAGHLKAVLEELGVPGAGIDSVISAVASLRPEVVERPGA